MSVVIETTIGDITIDLFCDERPNCCQNFLKLCKIKYYNNNKFHLIAKDFIAQTGDASNTGYFGESIYSLIDLENHGPYNPLDPVDPQYKKKFFVKMEKKPKIKHNRFGLISMANNGQGFHASQFFFTLSDHLDYLDNYHTVFGEVVEGLEVLYKLNDQICDDRHRPYQDIMITHTVVLDDPFPDIPGLIRIIPPQSPTFDLQKLIDSDRIGIAEDVLNEDKDPEQIEEELKDKEAKQRALVLEMIGDIPDAEIKPPENVLFVCKLNPVTKEEDLEIIFSRFGKILSCEIIKDDKTGESLQYGFIEFDKKEDCEKAYFKMDNVLIDDRRIHVDFSQSVSKIKWRGKGRGTTFFDPDDPDSSDNNKSSNNSSKTLKYIESLNHGTRKDDGSKDDGRKDDGQHREQQQSKRKDYDDRHYHQDRQDRQDRNQHHHQSTSSTRDNNYRSSHDDYHHRSSRRDQREEEEEKRSSHSSSSKSKDYHQRHQRHHRDDNEHHHHRHHRDDDDSKNNKKRRSHSHHHHS